MGGHVPVWRRFEVAIDALRFYVCVETFQRRRLENYWPPNPLKGELW